MTVVLERLAATNVALTVRGIRLDVDAPADVLTPEFTNWLRCRKAELIEAVELTGPCDRCSSPTFIDHSIHNGASTRRDCAACGRTWGFPRWQEHPPSLAGPPEGTPGSVA